MEEKAVQLPLVVSLDFEAALINSVQTVHKPESVIGCFFHYSQAFWRKANDMKLRKHEIKLLTIVLITSMRFLCFVSKNDVVGLWDQIKEAFRMFRMFETIMIF